MAVIVPTDRRTSQPDLAGDRPDPIGSSVPIRSGNAVQPASITAMFDDIAPVYDRLNTVLTLGLDGGWRRAAVEATGLRAGDAAIDVACGTGKLSAALAECVGPFGRVLGVDLSSGMLARAAIAQDEFVQLDFVRGDALALPAQDGEFDAATIAFGLRNLADYATGFAELRRVVRPGGRVVCLELGVPRPAAWGRVFHATFRRVAPLVGRLAGRPTAYRYLPDSLDGFPGAPELAAAMRSAGLIDVSISRLGLGSVTLHTGTVPERV